MENFEEQEQILLEQLNALRQKKQQQQSQQHLKDKLVEKEVLLQTLDDDIKSKKEIYFKLQNEIPLLENDRCDLHQEIKDIKKQLKEPVVIPIPVVEVIEPIPEPVVIQDPLHSFESSKQLTHQQLDKLGMYERSIEVNMCDLQVGDFILTYTKYSKIYGRVSRRTNKTIFIQKVEKNDANLSLHYDWKINGQKERTYDYYYFNINLEGNVSTEEIKMTIKEGKAVKKAIKNFVVCKEFDWGA
jgi:hypothetical protein